MEAVFGDMILTLLYVPIKLAKYSLSFNLLDLDEQPSFIYLNYLLLFFSFSNNPFNKSLFSFPFILNKHTYFNNYAFAIFRVFWPLHS